MISFAAQVGWLSAKPQGHTETRHQMFGGELPELPAGELLADKWMQAGRAKPGFSGYMPLEWVDLQAFNALTGADLLPCEADCLVEMSRAYCAEIAETNPLRISPMERD